MIITMIPYCPSGHGTNLGHAYNEQMKRLDDDDWACFIDHDACFTTRQWYRQLEAITQRLDGPAVLTAMTNRVGSRWQIAPGVDPNNHSMEYHRAIGEKLMGEHGAKLTDVTDHPLMSGVVILLSKNTWKLLGGFEDGFLGVDNAIHQAARDKGFKVYLMEGLYVYHWYRADTGGRPVTARDVSAFVAGEDKNIAKPPTSSIETEDTEVDATESGNDDAPPTILEQVPTAARNILCVGQPTTSVAQLARRHRDATVTGIVPDTTDIEAMEDYFDQLVAGPVEEIEPQSMEKSFDCVIVQDALDCAKRPQVVLDRMHRWLAPDGRLLATIRNARHHQTVSALLGGQWSSRIAQRGEMTHPPLKFHTRREMEKLFYRAGFRIEETRPLKTAQLRQWRRQGTSGEVDVGGLHIGGLSPEEAEEFFVEEYLIRAVPVENPRYGMTSIVILTRNQLSYTQTCLESIRFRTDVPYELIVVDNGSADGTVEYLRAQPDVTLIENADNRGFPAGCNQGIRAATGEHVLLLNNDVIVTTGWLDRMLAALHDDPKIGLVGPCTNNISGEQQVPVTYEDLSCLDGFAWEWGKRHDREPQETDRLVGFCLLVRKSLVDEIGLLDERFGLGNFEDDDYCRRAGQAGYRAVIARDAFVHHFGSVTHRAEGIDHNALLEKNGKLFREKCRKKEEQVEPDESDDGADTIREEPRFSVKAAKGGGLLLQEAAVGLSLCMIVRDNADTIGPALESIRPWVDEMVVVDTGSKDNTPEIARRLGARVFHFPWCDDFAAARNESIRHARGEWIFWMDSDDVIDEASGRKLHELVASDTRPSVLGYVMQVHCPGNGKNGQTDVTIVDHVKLFRNRPDLRFECRIHEQILPSIRAAEGEVEFTDVFVVHAGADRSDEGKKRKLERDFRLLWLELADRPDHPFALFNLGMTHADTDQHEEAITALRRSIKVSEPTESHVRKAYALLIGSYAQLERYDEAWRACQQARDHYPDDAELLFRHGVLHHHFKRLDEAERAYLQLLEGREERHFSSVDHGIKGFKARHNLALVYEDMDDLPRAEEQWRQVVAEAPTYRLGWRGLGDVLLRQSKLELLEAALKTMPPDDMLPDPVFAERLILQGHLAVARENLPEAKLLLQQAVDQHSADLDAHHALCRFLFEHGQFPEAETALTNLLNLTPDDAAALHNLGTIYLQTNRPQEAVTAYQSSLRHRPDSPATEAQLGQALEAAD